MNVLNIFNFSLPDQNKLELWRPELKYGEQDYGTKVVRMGQQHWIFKHSPDTGVRKRELLAYLLGKDLINIAEVKPVSDKDVTNLKDLGIPLPDAISADNTILVRLAQDYSVSELPLKTLDEATAGELVFSIWTRRRDAHENNHAYIKEKIPVFFDHHASLNFEPVLIDTNTFFKNVGAGHAGTWRVKEVGNNPIDILRMRSGQWSGNHFIYNVEGFKEAVSKLTALFVSDNRDFKILVKQAGFEGEEAEKISNFIYSTQSTLPTDIEEMYKIIWKDN